MYNQDGTRYQDILLDRDSNLLSNGQDMAWFSNDYIEWIENGNTLRAIEIWPQLYEKAWVFMNGGTFTGIEYGSVSNVWKALTGSNVIRTDCIGKTSNEILQIIDDAVADGKIICIDTKPGTNAISMPYLPSGAHSYYLTGDSINNYKMINPWSGIGTPPNFTFRDIMLSDLIHNTNLNLDLSQYITAVHILDSVY